MPVIDRDQFLEFKTEWALGFTCCEISGRAVANQTCWLPEPRSFLLVVFPYICDRDTEIMLFSPTMLHFQAL